METLSAPQEHKSKMTESRIFGMKMDKVDIIWISISIVSIGMTLIYMIVH